jgi:hypothetical protein
MRLPVLAATGLLALAATAFQLPEDGPADPGPRPLPAYAASPDDAVIRPGAGMIEPGDDRFDVPGTELDAFCTWDWLFHDVVEPDPETGVYPEPKAYIGTAAHCTDEVGQRLGTFGADDFGTVVYDSDDIDSPVDFALVQIDADKVGMAHPQMFGAVAPTGFVTADDLALGDVLVLHGYGLVVGQNDVTRDRHGIVTDTTEDEYVADTGATFGDSGGPLALLSTGEAVGIISRYGFDQFPPTTDVGPLIPWILEHLADAGFRVELATIGG